MKFGILDIGMSTSSSRICFGARARASNTNDSFGIPSISKQTLEGQKQIDESGLLEWQTFGQRSKDKKKKRLLCNFDLFSSPLYEDLTVDPGRWLGGFIRSDKAHIHPV